MANKFGAALMESDKRVEQALQGKPENMVASHDAEFNANIERLERERKAEQPAVTIVQKVAEPTKGVQTNIVMSDYLALTNMKLTSQERTTIGDLVAQAIHEFVERRR